MDEGGGSRRGGGTPCARHVLSRNQALMWVRGLFTRPKLGKGGTNCEPLSRFRPGTRSAEESSGHTSQWIDSPTLLCWRQRAQRWQVSRARSPPSQRTWTLLPVGGAGSPQHLRCGSFMAAFLHFLMDAAARGRPEVDLEKKKKKTLMCNSLEKV